MVKEARESNCGEELTAVLPGNERVLSRLITIVENSPACAYEIMPLIHSSLGRARSIGFTGPPGAGKSSLVNQVIRFCGKKEKRSG